MSETIAAPEQRTIDVDIGALDTRGRTVVGYAALYDQLSEDLGGYRERISPGAFAGVLDSDVRALLNHDPNEVLGRTKSGTLRLFDEPKGLRFELDLPDSPLGENVRAAVKRGDVDGASFRFLVDREAWDGDVRTVQAVKQLHDVTLATFPAYPASSIELRTRTVKEEPKMDEATLSSEGGEEAAIDEKAEQRTSSTGTLRVRERDDGQAEFRSLLAKYLDAGFQPGGQRTELAWQDFQTASESRALTWTGSVDLVNQRFGVASPFGYDRRWAWPAFPQVPVDSATTSVNVLTQTARTLVAGGTAVRSIDNVTNKPETATTVTSAGTAMKQVASVVSGVPNIMLAQNNIESILGQDLRLSYSDGLDFIVTSGLSTAGTWAQGTTDSLLVAIRKGVSVLWSAGYAPDTLVVSPSNSESLDLTTSGGTAGWPGAFTFGAGQFGPSQVFGMNVRVSKNAAGPVLVDAAAFGKLYLSSVSLASFEENAGKTNSSLVRFEGNAAFGIERLTAAVRIT